MTLRYRPLGGTGIRVSTYCLGTMMFGADGNRRPRRMRPHHPRGPRRGDQLHRHGRLLRRRGRRNRADRGFRTAGRRDDVVRDEGALPDGPAPLSGGNSRAGSPARSKTACDGWTPTGSTFTSCTGRNPATDIEETLSALTRPRAGRQDPRVRPARRSLRRTIAEAHAVAAARGLMRPSGPSSPRTRSSAVALSGRCCCCASVTGWAVLTWSPLGWGLPHRPEPARGTSPDLAKGRAALNAARFDPARPENQRKLDAAEKLARPRWPSWAAAFRSWQSPSRWPTRR